MSKRWRTLWKWSFIGIIVLPLLLVTPGVQAYTIYSRVWPAANVTYRRDASFDNRGQAWIDEANTADADWAGVFQFNLDNNSANLLRATDMGANGLLGLTSFFPAVGPYRIGFTLDINRQRLWHTGPPPIPVNRYDLQTVLRHEFGHVLGLWHFGFQDTLMFATIDPGDRIAINQDALNGANFLYNPGAGAPIPEGPAPQSAATGTNNNSNTIIGYKGPNWVLSSPWPRAYQQDITYSNGNQAGAWMWFNGSTITRRYTMAGNRGNHTIYIDGAQVANNINISDNAATTRWQVQKTWSVPNGQHFIEVRRSGANYSDLDAFIVDIPTVGAGMYDDPDGQFKYIGNWTNSAGWPLFPNGPHNGTVSYTNSTEDAVTFTFTGRRIRYYFTKANNRGIAAITIDGVHIENVNACSAATVWRDNNTYPREGRLEAGVHTIHISNTGQTTCGDGGVNFRYIDVDALEPIAN